MAESRRSGGERGGASGNPERVRTTAERGNREARGACGDCAWLAGAGFPGIWRVLGEAGRTGGGRASEGEGQELIMVLVCERKSSSLGTIAVDFDFSHRRFGFDSR